MEYEIGANEPVSTAVVRAAAAVEGRHPRSMRPLWDVLDPEALDGIFESKPGGDPRIGGRLSFVYSKCRVTVDNGEFLTIQPLETLSGEVDEQEPGDHELRQRGDR